MTRGKTGKRFIRVLVLLALLGLVFIGVAAFRAGPAPTIAIASQLPGIGKRTPIKIILEEPKRGLNDVKVEFVQGERVETLQQLEFQPLEPWAFWGERTRRHELTVEVGRETLQGLKEGEAEIRVTAEHAGAYLRFPEPSVETLALPVKLRPPQLQILSTFTYVAQGGCETVVYRVGESSVRDGVQAGDWWFPGFPLPGGDPQDRFALFSAPYDVGDDQSVRLHAFDDVENRSEAAFIDRFFAKPFKTDTIRLSESFMARVVPAIMDQTPDLSDRGNLLDNYLMINGDLRNRNSEELVELAGRSLPDFLWEREFMQMRNAQVMSAFADRRTYLFEGNEVDQQDHLGYDLASTSRADVQASNNGVVVLARYFGIYGNAVVIDHGYGLMSLYGHLSEIRVQEGQEVRRGEVVGRSGQTGLAGGDHLHFTMLLQGLPVNPSEWWDSHWIHDRLKLKLEGALPFGG